MLRICALGFRCVLATAFVLFVAACGGSGYGAKTVPIASSDRAALSGAVTVQTTPAPQSNIPNAFATARNADLSDSDIDSYIDPSVTGSDRVLAHKLMRLMPSNARGDFIYTDGTRIISNNRALARASSLTQRQSAAPIAQPASSISTNAVRRPQYIVSACSPPDPYTGSGPYVRDVANCGFAGGWGVVNLECGASQLNNPSIEYGYMYYELRDESGNLYEGGLFDPANDYSLNPYLSASTGLQLNWGSNRFTCGTDLGVMFGLVPEAGQQPYLYVMIGTIANWSPALAFQPQETLTYSNSAWLFTTAPGNVNYPGTDAAGVPTACTGCGVTKVTSIGQKGGDFWDNSTFGIDPASGQNAVHWEEVVFGNWLTGCNFTLCTLEYSLNQSLWYAGQENYYNSYSANSVFMQNHYVFESFDGVIASNTNGPTRGAASAFRLSPPSNCSFDAYGYCVYSSVGGYSYRQQTCLVGIVRGQPVYSSGYFESGSKSYIIEGASYETLKEYTGTYVVATCASGAILVWTPGEPKTVFGDPNLP